MRYALLSTSLALASLTFLLSPSYTFAQDQNNAAQPAQTAERVGDPYTLPTDALTGEPLGEKPVIVLHEGRELRFSNEANATEFKENADANLAAVDKRMIEQQLPFYALTTCPVGGGGLDSMGGPVDVIHGNRLVRLCCGGCEALLSKKHDEVFHKTRTAALEAQTADYPLTTCVVTGEPLDAMGEPTDVVIANQLVRLCCPGCVGSLQENPAEYLGKLDAARAEKQ